MKILRTPDERFEGLHGYDFAPHYINVDDGDGGELRIHYLDEGSSEGLIVVLMHGEPSWSYLYRKMIPGIVDAGHRVLAPDLVGFGRSDKPADRNDYSYQRHVDWMTAWMQTVDVNNALLFCQDWGGLIGLRLVAEHAQRFAGVIAANTFLPTGDHNPGEAFMNWQNFSQSVPEFDVGGIIKGAVVSALSEAAVEAYNAPFPDESYKEGARQFPMLVPIRPDDPASDANRAAWRALSSLSLPFMTAFSDKDPITAGQDKLLQKMIPGCKGQKHTIVTDGGHFLQEDKGEELAGLVNQFIADNKLA